jgi:hypothetical protein
MSIVPKDKFDLDSIKGLSSYSNEELEPYLGDMLSWVQDINWPVANPIAERLANCGLEIVEPIKKVLQSQDAIWKYYVISHIVINMNNAVREQLLDEIVRIINMPTELELKEDVHLVARDIMVMNSHGI